MTKLNVLNSKYDEKYGFSEPERFVLKTEKGLSEEVVRKISQIKKEPEWMLNIRLNALKIFNSKPMPEWGGDLSGIDFDRYTYFASSSEKTADSWDDVPEDIKRTFDRLGIPEAERKFLGGVGAQYESQTVYHKLREDLERQGVVFTDTDSAVKNYPDIVKKYFSKVVPAGDNKFAALNTAVWSGGSFIYIPDGVEVKIPLQAYFRINARNIGQFERTLIIVGKGAKVHYIEGCTAPTYSTDSLHAAVVEVVALEGAKVRYTTIQNWSSNVYNLVTKRAFAYKDSCVEWVDGNLGSKLTMKYPSVYLKGDGARADILSIAYAGDSQHQDAGGKVFHLASNTQSRIISKSISKGGGRSSYRGLVKVAQGAKDCTCTVQCDALLLDDVSRSDTYPSMQVDEESATIAHEASVGKVGDDQIFYLMQRGHSQSEALALIVLGFISDFTKELPMEYAVELKKLIQLEMEGSVA
ncbi:Fe-S cluster assembly protein SufB [Candidatus Woesearchaeota archaeon]|nr:MAG: Fe-S cluster assembly protein SufB [Candidatus Woesearchaeota archaeon]